ncbi:hypothetical protein OGAPHI_002916 [Ogataea philodendri]|uniref:Uncharacterized protein n=1 Tax=Ogataea philodendri TaxID=1378263 RepID=A0A9P8P8K0_9ASCO|nr:uncharacterized protein OGAPHI_002916 [Ogataea philodendri]KAH3667267.1 hypothetical protein OGAPHI_002916 [Ogataea philodendri]
MSADGFWSGSILAFLCSSVCLTLGAGSTALKLTALVWLVFPFSWLLSEFTSELTIDGTRFSLSDLLYTTYAAAIDVANIATVDTFSSRAGPFNASYSARIFADTCRALRRSSTKSGALDPPWPSPWPSPSSWSTGTAPCPGPPAWRSSCPETGSRPPRFGPSRPAQTPARSRSHPSPATRATPGAPSGPSGPSDQSAPNAPSAQSAPSHPSLAHHEHPPAPSHGQLPRQSPVSARPAACGRPETRPELL